MNDAITNAVLLDMQRCLLWMEHVNRRAEREEKMGHWLSDHTAEIQHWDAEYTKARERFVLATQGDKS